MAGSSGGEEENYWPGYVDALTTMTMVMTFIMMVLGVVVFTLSQNTAKNILMQVAKVAEIDTKDMTGNNSKDLQKVVLDALAGKLEDDKTFMARSSRPVEKPSEESRASDAGAAVANNATQTQVAPLEVPDDKKAPETRVVDDHTARDMTEHARGGEVAKGVAPVGENLLRVVFRNGAVQIEADTARAVTDYAKANSTAPAITVTSLAVAGVAVPGAVSATEARRRAYYRALLVRQQMLAGGVPAERITIEVRDGTAADGFDTVKIVPGGPAQK